VTSATIYYCDEKETTLLFPVYQFAILFALPAILMVVCYVYVIRELWRSTRNINILTNAKR